MLRVFVVLVCVLLYRTEATISGWTTPTITEKDGAGALTVSDSQAISESITTFAATTDAGPITYSLQTAVTPFALSNTGVLTVTAKLDSSTTASYTLTIQAVDATPTTGIATITVTVTANKPPVFGQPSYTACIADESPADTSVITVTATDPDAGDTLTYSVDSNGNTDFKIDSSTGEITVNSGKTLDMSSTPAYTLVVKVVDSSPQQLTGSTTVSIQVTADGHCSGNGSGSGDGNGGGDGNGRSNGDGSGNGNGSGSATAAANIMPILLALFVTF